MDSVTTNPSDKKRGFSGCILAVGFVMLVACGGLFLVAQSLTSFDRYRDKMGIRVDLVVEDEALRYSPGFDAAMWCRFTAKVTGIDQVFDTSKVDTSEFSEDDYDFGVDWIKSYWWDVDHHRLLGGEVQVNGDVMRVAYLDHGDGTLTIYVFWFEV